MRKVCDGLILKVTDIGEHDRALTLLTADDGKFYIIAKGARSVRSKFASLCRICAYVNVELHEREGRYWLSSGSINQAFFGINSDLDSFALASYVMQLADEITGESFPAHEVLRMSLNTLYAIEKKLCPLGQIKATYEAFAANVSGFTPDLSTCSECDCQSFPEGLWLDVMNGALICPDCLKKRSGGLPIPEVDRFETKNILLPLDSSALEALRYISSAPLQRIFAYSLNDTRSMELFCRAAETYLLHHLERDFDTLHFYKTVTK